MMHQNSLEAHAQERDAGRLSKRAQAIMWLFDVTPGSNWTDRQVMKSLNFRDPNAVRPRITELVKSGRLEECGSVIDTDSGKRVRLVRLRQPQGRLF